MRITPITRLLLVVLLVTGASGARAGGSQDAGDYEIHYSAISTDQLAPAVATAYNVVRSRNRALLNIAVTRKQDGRTGLPVEARVNVEAANLSGQVKNPKVRMVTEDGDPRAVYYIAEVSVADGETLVFDVKVTPEDSNQTHAIRFRQQFFAN